MSWLETAERIGKRVVEARQDDLPVLCLLGPPGSGKTDSLRMAVTSVRQAGRAAFYLDLRQAPEPDADGFFKWMLSELRRQGWSVPARLASARLDFVPRLAEASRSHPDGALLALDHIEATSEPVAKALVSDLREYQEHSAFDPGRRILCVLSGCASMIDLRKRANSPNLQFTCEILPAWNGDGSTGCVKQYLSQNGWKLADEAAVRQLADWTGGEPAFLAMFTGQFGGGPIGVREVQRAARAILQHAGDLPYLTQIVTRYWIDAELRRCADLLVNKRPAFLKDAATVFSDLDRLQLRGVLVAQTEPPFRYRLRNLLVERMIGALREAHLGRPGAQVDDGVVAIGHTLSLCHEAATLEQWKTGVVRAWALLLGEPADHLEIQFATGPAKEGAEPWCLGFPRASCWVEEYGKRLFVEAEVQAPDRWFVRAEVRPGQGFRPTVQSRHSVECWLSFFAGRAERAALLHLAETGSAILRKQAEDDARRTGKVFVVFGRDARPRDALYKFLRQHGLEPIDWPRAKELTGSAAPSIFDVVDTAMRHAQVCMVLLTGDDEGRLLKPFRKASDEAWEHKLTPQPRPNVIFEAGMALGRYRDRTILIKFGRTRPFSDVGGFTMIEYKAGPRFRRELLGALRTAQRPGNSYSVQAVRDRPFTPSGSSGVERASGGPQKTSFKPN